MHSTQKPDAEFSGVIAAIERHGTALHAAKAEARSERISGFVLGGLLARVDREGLHIQAGFDGPGGWRRYVEHLGVEYRTARYLLQLYRKITSLGVPDAVMERFAAIGWTKTRDFLEVVSADNIVEICEIAEQNLNRKALAHAIRRQFNLSEPKPRSSKQTNDRSVMKVFGETVEFRLADYEIKLLLQALETASAYPSVETPADALTQIILEWATLTPRVQLPLETIVTAIEAVHGVRLKVETLSSGKGVNPGSLMKASATTAADVPLPARKRRYASVGTASAPIAHQVPS